MSMSEAELWKVYSCADPQLCIAQIGTLQARIETVHHRRQSMSSTAAGCLCWIT